MCPQPSFLTEKAFIQSTSHGSMKIVFNDDTQIKWLLAFQSHMTVLEFPVAEAPQKFHLPQ